MPWSSGRIRCGIYSTMSEDIANPPHAFRREGGACLARDRVRFRSERCQVLLRLMSFMLATLLKVTNIRLQSRSTSRRSQALPKAVGKVYEHTGRYQAQDNGRMLPTSLRIG
jgi:hypothetical protein